MHLNCPFFVVVVVAVGDVAEDLSTFGFPESGYIVTF